MKRILLASAAALSPLTGFGIVDFEFNSSPTGPGSVSAGAVYRFDVTDGTNNTNAYDMILRFDTIATGTGSGTASVGLTPAANAALGDSMIVRALQGNAANDPYSVLTFRFIDPNTPVGQEFNNAYLETVSNLNIQIFDIDSSEGNNFTDMVGYHNSLSPFVTQASNTNLEQVGFQNSNPVPNFTMFREIPDQSPPPDWTDNPNIDNTDIPGQEPITVSFTFSSFSEGQFVIGFTGGNIDPGNRGFIFNMSNPPFIPNVPEPAHYAGMFGLMALGFAYIRRRRRA